MSFDIYFSPNSSDGNLNIDAIRTWFSNRPNYTLEDDNLAGYVNEETGVYFCFEFQDQLDEEDDPLCSVNGKQVSFSINFLRPLFFGHEANIELKYFTEKFGLNVLNLQKEEETYQPYDEEKFIASWTKSSAGAFKSIQTQHPELDKIGISGAKLLNLWHWNYHRNVREENLKEDIFIPLIYLFGFGKEVYTGIVWTDGIATLIPTCEGICTYREELIPKSGLFKKMESRNDFFPWSDIKHLIEDCYYKSAEYANALMPDYEDCPKLLKKAFRNLPISDQELKIIPFDEVIDAELLL